MVSTFVIIFNGMVEFSTTSTSNIMIIGTRPALPAINLGKEYDKVFEMFYACTTADYKLRPSAKSLVNYFKNYVYTTNK